MVLGIEHSPLSDIGAHRLANQCETVSHVGRFRPVTPGEPLAAETEQVCQAATTLQQSGLTEACVALHLEAWLRNLGKLASNHLQRVAKLTASPGTAR